MAYRALIIAIENYSKAKGGLVATKLPGTLQAGKDFKEWLENKWKAEGRTPAETEILFCSEPSLPNNRGAARQDVLAALDDLRKKPQNTTDELFVLFSGHGFAFDQNLGDRTDIIICSDFEDAALSGHTCLNFDEIVGWLRWHLGPGRHYYFVDACRNALDGSQIAPGSLLPRNPQRSSEPSTYVLQSTVPGAVAAVGGPFPTTLLAGLKGTGKAKIWDPQFNDRMLVNYESLRRYVKSNVPAAQPITSQVRGVDGESDAVLATIQPVPKLRCKIQVEKALATDRGELHVKRGRSSAVETHSIKGKEATLLFEPDKYSFLLKLRAGTVTPGDSVPVDLYTDDTVVFQKVRSPTVGSIASGSKSVKAPPIRIEQAEAEMNVSLPRLGKLKLRNIDTGDVSHAIGAGTVKLASGRYMASLRDANDRILGRTEISLQPKQKLKVNPSSWRTGVGYKSIAARLPDLEGSPLFSEELGDTAIDADLDVWLALIGGGRILRPREYSKLKAFPLYSFDAEQPGTAPIYVLAGFDQADAKLSVSVSTTRDATWHVTTEPQNMPGIREFYFANKNASPELVSFRINDGPPYTIASLASKNRAMLITITSLEGCGVNISQYLLPIGGLVDEMALRIEQHLRQTSLHDILFLARAAKAFRGRKNLELQLKHDQLTELLDQKWLDPIACAMAAYEFIRRGKENDLKVAVANMQKYFADVPDTAALAILSGIPAAGRPLGVPLFSDGLQAFPDYEQWLPLPANHLDFTSPWTAWRSAVSIS